MKSLLQASARIELLARLERLHSDSSARWGRMSAGEMLAHLNDAFRMAFGALPVERARGRFVRLLSIRPINYLAACCLPFGRGLRTAPELIRRRPESWAAEMAAFRANLDEFGREFESRPVPEHPFFGWLPHRLWGILGHRHIAHHLRQFGV